jgi:hypothetical protein
MVLVHPCGTTVVKVPAVIAVPSEGLADVLGEGAGVVVPLPHAGRTHPSRRPTATQRRTESREQTSSVAAAPTDPV